MDLRHGCRLQSMATGQGATPQAFGGQTIIRDVTGTGRRKGRLRHT